MLKYAGLVLAIMLLVAAGGGRRALADADKPAHFIVLIDDSGDMRRYRDRIGRHLPRLLFEGIDGIPFVRPGDHLSMGYYGVTTWARSEPERRAAHPCHPERPGNSLLPQHVIDWVEGVEGVKDVEEFTRSLNASQADKCRNGHRWSPIAIAEMLALPAANSRVPAGAGISRVFIVNVTNEVFNVEGQEVSAFSSRLRVINDETALDLSRRVGRLFHRHAKKSWEVRVDPSGKATVGADDKAGKRSDLVMRVTEMIPAAGDLAALVEVPSEVRIERHAVGPDKIALTAAGGAFVTIRESDRVRPRRLNWSSTDPDPTWAVGGMKLPLSGSQDLNVCQPPCRPVAGGLQAPLLDIIGVPRTVRPGASPSRPAAFAFVAEYDFVAPSVYDHLRVVTPSRPVEMVPVPMLTLPAGTGAGAVLDPDLFAPMTIDDHLLARQWRDEDQAASEGLGQQGAHARLLAARDAMQIIAQAILVALAIMGLTFLLLYLYRRHFHRPFVPQLTWQGVDDLTIDFNGDRGTPLLAGSLMVNNRGRVPFFGRLLNNTAQPRAAASFTLAVGDPAQWGIEAANTDPLVGFAWVEKAAHLIQPTVTQTVSDGTSCDVFLAPRVIADIAPRGGEASVETIELAGAVVMSWGRDRHVEETILLRLTVIPERSHPPQVTFHPSTERLEFATEEDGSPAALSLGTYRLTSTSRHRGFALPYRGTYAVAGYHRTLPLAEAAFRLSSTEVSVPPGGTCDIALHLLCDGRLITNPEHEFDLYAVRLLGEAAEESDMERQEFKLLRDSTQPDIGMRVSEGGRHWQIHFGAEGIARRIEEQATGHGSGEPVEGGQIQFAHREVRFAADSEATELLTLEFRNVARNGQGYVEIELQPRLTLDPAVKSTIDWAPDKTIADLFPGNRAEWEFEVAADGSTVVRHIRIDTNVVKHIHGAVIRADKAKLVVDIHVRILDRDHRPLTVPRSLSMTVPLEIEQLPDPNWLCIDFGTSAIAAAVGEGGTVTVLDLQRAHEDIQTGEGGIRIDLATEDQRNSERGSRFLPSFVLCDADIRKNMPRTADSTKRKGFPRYPEPSLRPGEPDFLSVPATTEGIRHQGERVVYSLKSWLGMGADEVVLGTEVSVEDDGGLDIRRTNLLPVDPTVESAFAALAEAYLQPLRVHAGKVVVTHPNTFTPHHVERLKRIVFRALTRRMNVPRADRIRMVSESDAAAFHHYTAQRSSLTPETGTETILVYDFGAGTLDLSLVRVVWSGDDDAPTEWNVLGRLGVPIAGNFLDGILARLIDKSLCDPEILHPEYFEYQYPVVGTQLSETSRRNHRAAVVNLWGAIREAKHADGGWKGDAPFVVELNRSMGHMGMGASAGQNVVQIKQSNAKDLERFGRAGDPEKPSILYRDRVLSLSLPARMVLEFGPLKKFLEFVANDVVDECLAAANVRAEEVTTVLVSGRGALWPGLREAVWKRFPAKVRKTEMGSPQQMKEAVVRGAIAWQALGDQLTFSAPRAARLAALFDDGKLVPEEKWGEEPLKFGRSAWFKIVQVAHRNPRKNDAKGLRRHFYVDLNPRRFRKESYFRDGKVKLERVDAADALEIVVRSSNNTVVARVNYETAAGDGPVIAPWPIGTTLLPPEEEED